jgi:hypothetical protein
VAWADVAVQREIGLVYRTRRSGRERWIGPEAVGIAAVAAELVVAAVVGLEISDEVKMRVVVGGIAAGEEGIAVADFEMVVAAVDVVAEVVVSVVVGRAVVVPAERMLVEGENTFVVRVVVFVVVVDAMMAVHSMDSLAELG